MPDITGIGTSQTRLPDPDTGKDVLYQTDKYSDGRIVTSKYDEATKQWVTVSTKIDAKTEKAFQDAVDNERKAAKAGEPTRAEETGPRTVTGADGTTYAWEPRKKAWQPIGNAADKPVTPAEKASLEVRKGELDRQSQNDVARIGVEKTNAQTAAGRLDLDRVESAARLKLQQLNSDVAAGRLSLEQRAQQWAEYKAQNIDAPIAQAHADAAKASAAASQQNAATNAQQQALAQQQYTEITKPKAAFDQAKTLYDVGREAAKDAVDNAMKLIPYQGGADFGKHFAETLGGTRANFSGDDFKVQMPDLNALAEQAAMRAHQNFQALRGSLGGVQPGMAAASTMPGAAPVAAIPNPTPAPNVAAPPPTTGYVPDDGFVRYLLAGGSQATMPS
jgi:hypothetical protein